MRPARCAFVVSAFAVLAALLPVLPASASLDDPLVMTFPAVADCDVKGGLGTTGTSYCTQPSVNVGYASGTLPLLPYARRGLLRFDLSALPAGVVVQNVSLSLTLNGTKPYGAATVDLHEPGAPWTTSATWQTSDGTTPWPSAGGAPGPVIDTTQAGPAAGRVTWTGPAVRDLALAWRATPSANRGLLVKTRNEGPDELNLSFATSESADPAARPALTVHYVLPPDAPVVSAASGVRSVSASWPAPASHGASVSGYTVRLFRGSVLVATDETGQRTWSRGGLANAATYHVEVTATNAAGTSPAGRSPDVVTPGLPSMPAGLAVTPGLRSLTVSWTGAAGNGTPVTSYEVSVASGSVRHSASVAASATSRTFTGLVDGATYAVSLAAVSAAGTGPAATASATTLADVPGAPFVTATRGNASLSVRWTDVDPHGSPVTSWTVTTSGPDGTVVATETVGADRRSIVVTGLTNGLPYRVDVAATNAAGTGPAGVDSETPWRVPGAVRDLAGTADDGVVTATWQPPDGDVPWTSYVVVLRHDGPVETTVTLPADATSWTFSGLTNGGDYVVEVTALAEDGADGPVASTYVLVPGFRPAAPVVTAERRYGAVVATFGPGDGTFVESYVVQLRRVADDAVVGEISGWAWQFYDAIFWDVEIGTPYYVSVVARNATGDSAPGISGAVTPALPPSPPGALTVVRDATTATLSWDAAEANGSPVTAYEVTAQGEGAPNVAVTVPASERTVVVDADGTAYYRFTVRAVNDVGTGEPADTGWVQPYRG